MGKISLMMSLNFYANKPSHCLSEEKELTHQGRCWAALFGSGTFLRLQDCFLFSCSNMCLGLKMMIKYSRGKKKTDVNQVNAKTKGGQQSRVSVRSAKPTIFRAVMFSSLKYSFSFSLISNRKWHL